MNKKNANSKNAFVTIVGRANAGKSSLLNALVGEKIAAVSDKPQTTRTKITGVLTKGETQFVFIDTPGMHKAKNKLSEHMLNAVNESVAGVNLIILMADCTKKISENERELVKGFKTGKTKVILVLNKIDLLENKVVLIKPKDGETKVTGFENITDAANIALAGDSVPVGQYSREIFDNLGITDEVNKMEINEGKNVSEVLAAVSEGSNEIGIVYATDAASVADKVDVIAEAPADALKTPVRYPVGLIEDKEASEDDTAATEAFLEYIKSDDAMKVFEKYGFTAYKADDASETDDKDAETTEETDDTETNAETETTEEAK